MENVSSCMEFRRDLELKLAKAFGVREDGTFYPGDVEAEFARMNPVPMFVKSSWQRDMPSVLRRLRHYYRADSPRGLAEAVTMLCTDAEMENLNLELERLRRQ